MVVVPAPVLTGLLILLGLVTGAVLYLVLDVRALHDTARANAAHRDKKYKEFDEHFRQYGVRLIALERHANHLNELHPPDTPVAQPKVDTTPPTHWEQLNLLTREIFRKWNAWWERGGR